MKISNSQIDRVGDRLRSSVATDADIQLLETYRLSFAGAFESVLRVIRNVLQLEPAGRPAKSTLSIGDKLRRESLRLKQMQDVAGCRVVVSDVVKQDEVVRCLTTAFPDTLVIDRRRAPSHGYRAVHVVVRQGGLPVEVQVRTELEQSWTQISERFSDVLDPDVKYGGGPSAVRSILNELSDLLGEMEALEATMLGIRLREGRQSIAVATKEAAENKLRFKSLAARIVENAQLWQDL